MFSVGNSVQGSAASLPLDPRVVASGGLVAAAQGSAVTPAAATSTASQKIPPYNAFEFIYRADYGRIILLEQNAETGQEVAQIPSQYHLQQYAASQRAQRVQLQQRLFQGGQSAAPGRSGVANAAPANATGGGTGQFAVLSPATVATSQPAAAPAQPAAPTVSAAAPARVDLKV